MTRREFEKKAHNYDAVLVRFRTSVREPVLSGGRLKAVLTPTTGLDHIDMEAAKRHHVKVYSLNGQRKFLKQVFATAEMTVALMMALLRKLPMALEAGKHTRWDTRSLRGLEVAGKTLGVVGYGRVGKQVARIAKAMRMNVTAYDPFVKRLPAYVEKAMSLQSLVRKCDIVSLHVPLRKETKYMIGQKVLKSFKHGAFLINTARGALIRSEPLIKALKTRKVAAAAIDVLETENQLNVKKRNALIDYAQKYNNLLITPHISGSTYESMEKTDLFILRQYLNK